MNPGFPALSGALYVAATAMLGELKLPKDQQPIILDWPDLRVTIEEKLLNDPGSPGTVIKP